MIAPLLLMGEAGQDGEAVAGRVRAGPGDESIRPWLTEVEGMDDSPRLRSLAVVATRGTTNNLFQVATLVRAATALECAVEVLFQDAALLKLRRDRINVPEWSPAYAAVVEGIEERLRAAEFVDMESFLRDAKQHGDAVHVWACAESLAAHGVSLGDLTPLLDGELAEAAFLQEARKADALLSF